MIKVVITDEMRYLANEKGKELGILKNSITRGSGNVIGFLGEIMVANYFDCNLDNSYQHDLKSPNGILLEVKTKKTKVKPRDYYEVSIAKFNIKQSCDYYVFCRVLQDQSVGWILGYDSPDVYKKTCKFLKKGEVDPYNNYIVKADCYNKPINKLIIPDNLPKVPGW